MKYIIIILLVLVSCKTETAEHLDKAAEVPTFGWLLGKWQRVHEEAGKTTFESWLPTHAGHYLGHGYTLQENDTVFDERLSIKSMGKSGRDNYKDWALYVAGVNENPTIFRIEEYDEHSFTAVNLQNEFPTHIRYFISNDTLIASVSNEEMTIDFEFVKQ